eukprot:TRINITY_DN75202_c0_g1_i1.p1 TRINITY_DN75202_c0_g1~~TRINITY_DN75202_c0_g1_i1.p1  ORF type:complete len:281 (-),score=91.82 TRINITY_DN75202_c0_g1_i1:98-940(-)
MQKAFVVASAFASVANGVNIDRNLRAAHVSDADDTFVRTLDFKQVLRVCNAYPSDSGLSVSLGKDKLSSSALPYKECQEYTTPLKSGDMVNFQVGDSTAGTFTISDLPARDATLMMIIHRHDTWSTSVAFESHVFANTDGPQVAVIDTYKGKKNGELHIKETKVHKDKDNHITKQVNDELLRFSSVVVVNPGIYELDMLDQVENATAPAKSSAANFVALPKQSYAIIRVGVEDEEGSAFPEEIMVFPHSDKKGLPHSAAAGRSFIGAILLAAAALAFPAA